MSKLAKAESKPPLCFVVGPIGKAGSDQRKHSDLLLNAVIKEVLEQSNLGYKVKRADEDEDPGMIGDRVVHDIVNAELVVADLTDLNPNAFYELGIRHSTLKPTIHMAKLGTVLPFDNMAHRCIFADLGDWESVTQARASLRKFAFAIREPSFRVSNPITQANASFRMRESEDPRDQVLADLQDRLDRMEKLNSRLVPGYRLRLPDDVLDQRIDKLVVHAQHQLSNGIPINASRRRIISYAQKLDIPVLSTREHDGVLEVELEDRILEIELPSAEMVRSIMK